MPVYEVELDDGRIVEIESDVEPDESSVNEALSSYSPTSESRGPAAPLNPWEDPKVIEQMSRSEQIRKDVGAGMEAGTEFTTALAEGIGVRPEVRRESPEEQMTPGLPEEQAALELERLRIRDEGVPSIWRLGAAAHTGLSKGMQLPTTLSQSALRLGRMLPGGKVAESLYAGINRDVFGNYLPDVAKQNDQYFEDVAKWERWMSERDALLGDKNFAAQLAEGTARGFAELPVQMLGGLAGSTPAAAMRGASIGAGITSGAMRFGQELGEGASDFSALTSGATSALITGLTTRAFGTTGVESIFRNQGVKGVANRIKDALKQAGYEGVEEATDTLEQDLADRFASNPNKPVSETIDEVLLSGSVGALLGGGMASIHALGGDRNASQDQETAAIYGDVRPQAQGQPTVPTQEGGARVQSDEEEYLRMEREGMGESSTLLKDAIGQEKAGDLVELGDLSTTEEGEQPFHGRLAIWDDTRKRIVVDPVAWHAEMQALPANKRAAAARTIINEEMTHAATTKEDALGFYNLASGIEKALGRRIYTGKWKDQTYSDQDIGYEMIRRRIQRINKMTPTELFNTSRAERMSVRSWQVLEDVIRKSREVLIDRGGSKKQIDILDRTLAKVQQVHQMAVDAGGGGEGEGPAAIARNQKVKEVVSRIEAGGAFPNNKAAVDAGLDAESIDDLDAMLEAKRDIQIKLQEARQRKDFNAMSTLVGPNQFLREAIEAATNAGSQRVDKRVTDYEKSLPLPKLDWRKNEQVRDWLEQNGDELGIRISEDAGPAALSRAAEKRIAKLREERLRKIAESERDELTLDQINEKIITLSGKSREAMLTENEQAELSGLRRKRFEMEKDSFGPAAIRRGGGTKRSQELSELRRKLMEARGEELAPELKTTGKPASGSAAEPVAPEERVAASETGALPRLSTEDLSAKAEEILSGEIKVKFRPKSAETLARDVERSNVREEEGTGRTGPFGISAGRTTAERPSFKEFNDWAKRNFEGAEPHQIRAIWEDSVWGMLLKADPERLDEWRKALGLEKKYGRSVIYQPTSSQKTAEFNLLLEEGNKVLARQQKASNEAAQRYRGKVIQAIAHKLVGESMDDRPSLDRSEIEMEDIDFGNAVAKFSPYQELGADDISNPDILKSVLRDQARASNTDPESASRRLVAVVDKTTGRVELLSTYNDAGVQRVTDPAGARLPKKPTRELNASFLRQYRPFASLLLKDPVRAFRKQFATVSEFNEKIGTEAGERSAIGENLQPGEADFKAEGTPGIEGEGGYLIGKHKAASGAEMSRPGVMESDAKLTKSEAREVVNQIWDEVGAFDSAEDVRDTITGLNDRITRRGAATSRERLAASGFRKIYKAHEARGIGKGYEAATPDEKHEVFLDRVANSIFSVNEFAKSPQEFVERITRLFEGEGSEAVSPEEQSKFGRELSTLRDVPPTRVRPEQLPPGVEPVVGREQEPPVPRLRYQPAEEAEPEALAPRTEGEKVAERAEQARHRERQIELNELWDQLMNEPVRGDVNRQLQAKAIRDTIYRRTGILISWKKAQEFVINKTGTPQEKVAVVSDKIEDSFSSEVRQPDAPTRPPGTIWRSGPRVAPHLRVKGPAALRRTTSPTLSQIASNALHDIGSGYDAWMVDRIDDYGGEEAKKFAAEARKIIDREKQLYGGLTPLLDRARKLAGGIEPSTAGVLDVRGRLKELPGRARSSFDAMRAIKWLNGLNEITPHTAVARVVRAVEGTIGIPRFAENVVEASQAANREIGAIVEPVTVRPKKKKRYTASGKFQRNLTSFGYDIIRQGGGDLWERWTQGIAEANKHVKGVTLDGVQKHFRRLKKTLDDPMTSDEILERINQDIARRYPRAVTHVKHLTRWQPVVHSDLFNYLENAARRATHIRAFRERYPKTDEGKKEFRETIDAVKKELTGPVIKDLTGVIRAMHGHPTDDYNSLEGTGLSPQEFFGQGLRMMNQTVNNVLGKMVLSGQMFVQPGEVMAGSTPVFFGYENYLRAVARYGQIYKLLEFNGARNPVMHDYTFNPTSPIRSIFKIGGNVISKVSMQNALNELQEGLAAATARVVAENIQSGNMSDWEKSMLPQTFRMMGFNPDEVTKIMGGDEQLLQQFQRKAAAFLTGGNKAIAESSRMGANRLFNSIFRFQTYPMIKTAQARGVLTNWVDAMREGGKQEKLAATRLAGRFFFGNALQGALTVGITALAYGGMSGLKIRMKEAEDEPWKFLAEAFLSSVSGPAYLLWRGKSNKGLGGYGEAAARLAFPYAVMTDMNDAAMGFGQYKDRPTWQRIRLFLKNKTPGTKAIRTGLAMFGLSQQNQKLDEAIKGLSRWRREELGFDENRSYPTEDKRKEFRMNMKRAIDAMKEGDQEAFNEAWIAAAEDEELTKKWMENPYSADVFTKVGQSFKARKLLIDNDGAELTEEHKEALRNRIGDEAYEALEYFDIMMDEAAEGVLLPRPD